MGGWGQANRKCGKKGATECNIGKYAEAEDGNGRERRSGEKAVHRSRVCVVVSQAVYTEEVLALLGPISYLGVPFFRSWPQSSTSFTSKASNLLSAMTY